MVAPMLQPVMSSRNHAPAGGSLISNAGEMSCEPTSDDNAHSSPQFGQKATSVAMLICDAGINASHSGHMAFMVLSPNAKANGGNHLPVTFEFSHFESADRLPSP